MYIRSYGCIILRYIYIYVCKEIHYILTYYLDYPICRTRSRLTSVDT